MNDKLNETFQKHLNYLKESNSFKDKLKQALEKGKSLGKNVASVGAGLAMFPLVATYYGMAAILNKPNEKEYLKAVEDYLKDHPEKEIKSIDIERYVFEKCHFDVFMGDDRPNLEILDKVMAVKGYGRVDEFKYIKVVNDN